MAFIPPWAALALGATAGLLVPLITFLVQYVLRIEDPTSAIPVGLLGGMLGVLAVGIFGDGLAGQGWNGTGAQTYLGVAGQGVTGFFPAPGLAPDWPGQINAQLVGLAAIAGLTVALVGGLFLVLKVLLLLWHAVPTPKEADQEPDGREPDDTVSPADEAGQEPVGQAPVDTPAEGASTTLISVPNEHDPHSEATAPLPGEASPEPANQKPGEAEA
jgi:Amt family ammonium transporter